MILKPNAIISLEELTLEGFKQSLPDEESPPFRLIWNDREKDVVIIATQITDNRYQLESARNCYERWYSAEDINTVTYANGEMTLAQFKKYLSDEDTQKDFLPARGRKIGRCLVAPNG